MFIKLTRASGHTYAQLVESFRDEHGRPRQRTLATIGRVDEAGGQVDALLKSLQRAKGQPASELSTPQVRFECARALGDVWALDQLWHARVRHQPPDFADFGVLISIKSTTCRCSSESCVVAGTWC